MFKLKKLITAASAGIVILGGTALTNVHASESSGFGVTSNGQTTAVVSSGVTGHEDLSPVLGNAMNFGVVANEWNFNGEAETDAAVKNFTHQPNVSNGQTGLTDKCKGSDYGYTVVGKIDNNVMIKGVSETIVTPDTEKGKFFNSTNGGKLTFEDQSEDTIATFIDNMLAHVTAESHRIAALDSIADYDAIPANQMTIDVTSAGTNTVYINVDKSSNLANKMKEASGLTVKKNPDQIVVFNFTAPDVALNKLEVEQNGQKYGGDSLANVSTKYNDIAEELIFNLPDATHAELHNITGVVLAPKATVETYDVTGGWIVADKFVNHCEHHFTNGSLPLRIDIVPPTPTVSPASPTHSPDALNPSATSDTTPVPSETPSVSMEPSKESENTSDTTPAPSEKPDVPEDSPVVKPKFAKVQIHAVINKDGEVAPEDDLKFEVKKTSYEIPEEHQNESDKDETESHKIEVGDVKEVTTNEEGKTNTELDKGTYTIEAKRENTPIVESGDKTNVYVHTDTEVTGDKVKDDTFEVEKVVNTEKSASADTPSEKSEEKSEQTPAPVEATSENEKPDNTVNPTTTPATTPVATTVTSATPTATENSTPAETPKEDSSLPQPSATPVVMPEAHIPVSVQNSTTPSFAPVTTIIEKESEIPVVKATPSTSVIQKSTHAAKNMTPSATAINSNDNVTTPDTNDHMTIHEKLYLGTLITAVVLAVGVLIGKKRFD